MKIKRLCVVCLENLAEVGRSLIVFTLLIRGMVSNIVIQRRPRRLSIATILLRLLHVAPERLKVLTILHSVVVFLP